MIRYPHRYLVPDNTSTMTCVPLHIFMFFSKIFLGFCATNGEGNICGRANGNDIGFEAKIVEGYDVGYYRYPWYTALVYPDNKGIACGGALIGSKVVITAAHCYKEFVVADKNNKTIQQNNTKLEDVYMVLLGVYNKCEKEKTQKYFNIQKVHIHEEYKNNWPYFDIAVLILKESTDGFKPICLPKNYIKKRPKEGSVMGLGTIKYHGPLPCTLREARLLIYPDRDCQDMINKTGNDPKKIHGAFCAGYLQGGIDTCQGDSGGPFQVVSSKGDYILQGLVSFGFHCANPGLLGVYVDVSQFVKWIEDKAGFKASDSGNNSSVSSSSDDDNDPSTIASGKATTTASNDDDADDDDSDVTTHKKRKTTTTKPKPTRTKPSFDSPSNFPYFFPKQPPFLRPVNIFYILRHNTHKKTQKTQKHLPKTYKSKQKNKKQNKL